MEATTTPVVQAVEASPPESPHDSVGSPLKMAGMLHTLNMSHGGANIGDEITESPRAASERVIETSRGALERARRLFVLEPALHGSHPVEVAWGASLMLATFGVTGEICFWDVEGKRAAEPVRLEDAVGMSGRSQLMWDAAGEVLFVLADGIGLHVWSKQGGLHQLASAQQSVPISFVCWSRTHAGLLAYGTDRGEIFLYQHAHGRQPERQNAGKHPSGKMPGVKSDNQIACGDWLRDGALALASGSRLKVSEPISLMEPRWKTFSKFRVHEMRARVPQSKLSRGDKVAYRALPIVVKASSSSTTYIAMTLGDKVVTIMESSGSYKEEGFFIPLDYGSIVGMEWLPADLLVIGLSNGYIISVNVPLFLLMRNNPAAARDGAALPRRSSLNSLRLKAMYTTRVMGAYLSDIKASLDGTRLCVLGDSRVKELAITVSSAQEIQVSVEVECVLPFESKVGTFVRRMEWGPKGIICITSNLGHVFAFMVPPSSAEHLQQGADESTAMQSRPRVASYDAAGTGADKER